MLLVRYKNTGDEHASNHKMLRQRAQVAEYHQTDLTKTAEQFPLLRAIDQKRRAWNHAADAVGIDLRGAARSYKKTKRGLAVGAQHAVWT